MEESRNIVDDAGNVVGFTLDNDGNPPPKVSKYDPPITDFLEGGADLKAIHHRNPDYLRTQLNKRIRARGLGDRVVATVIGGIAHLRRLNMPNTSVVLRSGSDPE